MNGSRRAAAIPLAALIPTSSAPIRPGPTVAATASTSSSVTPASRSAASTTGSTSSRWGRAATSGTTPPKPSWAFACEEITLLRMRGPRRTAAQVSSQEVSIASSTARLNPSTWGRRPQVPPPSVHPHDQGVLAVVVVVAGADAGGAEAEALVHADRAPVGDADLERERQRPPRLGDQPPHQLAGDAAAACLGGDGDVHQVPDLVVAGADHVAEEPPAGARGEADAGRLGELQHEHRQRPRRRERAPLDRDHRRQIAVGEPADLDLLGQLIGTSGKRLAHATAPRLGV